MKKSRILALLLCLCMLVGVLAACSKTDTTTPDASGETAQSGDTAKNGDVVTIRMWGGVPAESYEVPFGEPDVKREGKDVTILTIGAVLYRAMEAADKLQKEYGISAEIIDARSIVPFNYEKVIESVKKTGRIVIVGDACDRGSIMRDMASNIAEMAFDYLDAPPAVFGSRNWITPAFEFEKYFFPQADGIIDVISEKLLPLPGRVCTINETELEHIERSKKGL